MEIHPLFTFIEAINLHLNRVPHDIFTRVVINITIEYVQLNRYSGHVRTTLRCLFKLVYTGYDLTRSKMNRKLKQFYIFNVIFSSQRP